MKHYRPVVALWFDFLLFSDAFAWVCSKDGDRETLSSIQCLQKINHTSPHPLDGQSSQRPKNWRRPTTWRDHHWIRGWRSTSFHFVETLFDFFVVRTFLPGERDILLCFLNLPKSLEQFIDCLVNKLDFLQWGRIKITHALLFFHTYILLLIVVKWIFPVMSSLDDLFHRLAFHLWLKDRRLNYVRKFPVGENHHSHSCQGCQSINQDPFQRKG